MTRRMWVGAAVGLVLVGTIGWYSRNRLAGIGSRWYLARVQAEEDRNGELGRRRAAVAQVHRMLLLTGPPDALVPELFDLMTAMSERVSSGQINLNWAAYVYTSYLRDLIRERGTGTPRRSIDEIEAAVADYVRFYSLQQRPDEGGFGGMTRGVPDESFTVEEIERAAREGRDLTRP